VLPRPKGVGGARLAGAGKGKVMHTTGIVRKLDGLGRIVLPSEMRRTLGIRDGDELEINVENDRVILSKKHDVCIFCGAGDLTLQVQGRGICEACAGEVIGSRRMEIRLPNEAAKVGSGHTSGG
jgi:transcriptional pleiotropic regulator of transition state genes